MYMYDIRFPCKRCEQNKAINKVYNNIQLGVKRKF